MITVRNLFIYCIIFFLISPENPVSGQSRRGGSNPVPLPVAAFISSVPYDQADQEGRMAYELLKSVDAHAVFIPLRELKKTLKHRSRPVLLWIHGSDSASGRVTAQLTLDQANSLKEFTDEGGRLLLTNQAARLVNLLGYEQTPFQDSLKVCHDNGYGRRLGLHAFRDHPVFSGLNGGAYLLRPREDLTVRITGLFGADLPQEGKVVAADWDYIFLREETKLAFTYSPGKGRILAVGAYMHYSVVNTNRAHLARFSENCIRYLLADPDTTKGYYWDYQPGMVLECPPLPESDRLVAAVPAAGRWDIQATEFDLSRRFATDHFWDVAGERILTMGTERGGIEEVWAHPFMALRDYRVMIRFNNQDSLYRLPDDPQITVTPAGFMREYKFRRAYLREVIVNDPSEPGGVVHYEYRGLYPAELVVVFTSNLRWMWPYSEKVTGSVCHRWNPDLDALEIRDHSGDLNVMVGANRKPGQHLAGQYNDFSYHRQTKSFTGDTTREIQVCALLTYPLEMNDNLDIVFAASVEGYDSTLETFSSALRDPQQLYRHARSHTEEILRQSLKITTPDQDFNTGYRWAILATDRFFVHTPGMGKALTAGYSTTRHGWDGNHRINGRPGYGWYFGRDASWSGFALIDYGDFSKARSQLAFFNKYQDLNGKIFHEASTSGFLHYDAADATPLYIVLAGKYFRHSNDTAFLRSSWPCIKDAIRFCFSTDTDQDHLIENTNVGHGWVEGGKLYGSHSTIYMAGTWGAALREASGMAACLGDIEAESYRLESEEQFRIINRDFWSADSNFFAYGLNRDGSFRQQQTILPTVPVYFRMTEREKAETMLKSVAGNVFTTNWGARILRGDSPMFRPTGYHYGSVWPLFTGWASLAEYATGLPLQGFSHLMNNLDVYRSFGLGFVEEVLNGANYQPSGVCAHQCWSETMVIQPAIEGMLGLEVNAMQNKITLKPQLPPQWDSLLVETIRMGDRHISMEFRRDDTLYVYHFTADPGGPVTIDFMPSLPAGTIIEALDYKGRSVPFTTFTGTASVSLFASLRLDTGGTVRIRYRGGISALPLISDASVNGSADGMRILSARYRGGRYEVDLEGPSGSSWPLLLWTASEKPVKATPAMVSSRHEKITRLGVEFAPSAKKYGTQTIIVEP